MKYLFGHNGSAADLNSLDSGLYQWNVYGPKSEDALFDTGISYAAVQSRSIASTLNSGSFGNNPAADLPFGPIGLVNLHPFYLMMGNYDISDAKILKYTYGTAKPDFDVYEKITDAGNDEEYYVLDCMMGSLSLKWSINSVWSASGTFSGCAHGYYAGETAVDNGLPVDSQGTPAAVDSQFDTCESPLWNSNSLALQDIQIDISSPIFGNFGSDGKFRSINSQTPISCNIVFHVLGQDTNLKGDVGGTERTMSFTMGKSVNDHAAAFTLTNCGLISYRPTGKANNTRMVYECRAYVEDIYATRSGTNLMDQSTFMWVSQA